jgi:hypothetical protein
MAGLRGASSRLLRAAAGGFPLLAFTEPGVLEVAARVAPRRGIAAQDSSTAEAPPKMHPRRARCIARRAPTGPRDPARGLPGPVVTWPAPQ